ncbi:hypothetical protein D3C84_680420 [compost metagenome]
MTLIAHDFGIDVAGGQQVGVLKIARVQAIGVVGNVHLALADDLPVVALARTVEQAHFVHRDRATTARERHVETITRRLTHTARAGIVTPGLARFGLIVPELGAGIDLALVPLRQQGLVEIERRVAGGFANLARLQRRRQVARMHAAPVDVAVLEHIGVIRDIFLGPGAQGKRRGVFQ